MAQPKQPDSQNVRPSIPSRFRIFGPLAHLAAIGKFGQAMGRGGPPIAIDLGSRAIKLLQVQLGDKGRASVGQVPTLLGAASYPVPAEFLGDAVKRLDWQLENLPRLIKASGMQSKRAVCALPTSHMYLKHVQLPPGVDALLREFAASAVAGDLNCDPASLLVRHVAVPSAACPVAGKTEVIAMAVGRGLVSRMMDAIRAAKLDPVAIHPEPLATLRGFDHISRRAEDGELTCVYLDIGYGSTRVLIAHGADLVFAKTIAIGGRLLDSLVAKQSKCSPADAYAKRIAGSERLSATGPRADADADAAPVKTGIAAIDAAVAAEAKAALSSASVVAIDNDRRLNNLPKGYAPIAGAPLAADEMVDAVDDLAGEVAMCLRYYQQLFPGKKIGRCVFVGGEASQTALCQHIARVLRIPAHVADPLARVARPSGLSCPSVDLALPQPGWAVCLGLSLGPTDL